MTLDLVSEVCFGALRSENKPKPNRSKVIPDPTLHRIRQAAWILLTALWFGVPAVSCRTTLTAPRRRFSATAMTMRSSHDRCSLRDVWLQSGVLFSSIATSQTLPSGNAATTLPLCDCRRCVCRCNDEGDERHCRTAAKPLQLKAQRQCRYDVVPLRLPAMRLRLQRRRWEALPHSGGAATDTISGNAATTRLRCNDGRDERQCR